MLFFCAFGTQVFVFFFKKKNNKNFVFFLKKKEEGRCLKTKLKMNYCDQCETEKPTKACGRCFHAQYCSKQCQAKAWGHHKRCCYPLPRNLYENKENTILHKALEYNLFQEYQALTNNEQKTKLGEARQLLYQGIIECILIDPQTGDMPEDDELLDGYECATTKIKEAGILLNEINSMNNNFVFAFIPNEFHRDIDCLWDGIGSWRS